MAKFTPGPTIAEIRGSIGGTTFSQNRFGAYTRRRSVPTISLTTAATNAKQILSECSQRWGTLTVEQRDGWRQLAELRPTTDSLGNQSFPTGAQTYTSYNARRRAIPLAFLDDAPPLATVLNPFLGVTVSAERGVTPATDSIQLTFISSPVPSGQYFQIWAANIYAPGVDYVRNKFRRIGHMEPADTTPLDITTPFKNRLGALLEGTRVKILLVPFFETGEGNNFPTGYPAETIVTQAT